MRGRRRSIATAWWVLALFACTAAGPAVPGFALCVGTDGHVTVEGTHGTAPCATHYEQHHQPGPAAAAVDAPPDHGCFDTVLTPPRGERPRAASPKAAAGNVMVRVVPLHASPALGTFALGRSAAARDRVAHPDVLSGIRLLV
jgi:hypothetical protein